MSQCQHCGREYDARPEGQDTAYCETCVPVVEEVLGAVLRAYAEGSIGFRTCNEIREAYMRIWRWEVSQQEAS